MKKYPLFLFSLLIVASLTLSPLVEKTAEARRGCCSHHGGVCGCQCCDGSPLSAKCKPYYPWCNVAVPPRKLSFPVKPKSPAEPKIIIPPPPKNENLEAKRKLITKLGVVYIGMLKENLKNAGYTKSSLLDYRQEGRKEWMTFSDWTTPQKGDIITFIVEDGKVRNWMKLKKGK